MTWPFGVLCLTTGTGDSRQFEADDGTAVGLQRCAQTPQDPSQQWVWPAPWPVVPVGRLSPEHARLRCKKSSDCRQDGGYCCCQANQQCTCDPCFECCRDKNAVEGSCPAWCQCAGGPATTVASSPDFPAALTLGAAIEAQWSDGYWYGGKVTPSIHALPQNPRILIWSLVVR